MAVACMENFISEADQFVWANLGPDDLKSVGVSAELIWSRYALHMQQMFYFIL